MAVLQPSPILYLWPWVVWAQKSTLSLLETDFHGKRLFPLSTITGSLCVWRSYIVLIMDHHKESCSSGNFQIHFPKRAKFFVIQPTHNLPLASSAHNIHILKLLNSISTQTPLSSPIRNKYNRSKLKPSLYLLEKRSSKYLATSITMPSSFLR